MLYERGRRLSCRAEPTFTLRWLFVRRFNCCLMCCVSDCCAVSSRSHAVGPVLRLHSAVLPPSLRRRFVQSPAFNRARQTGTRSSSRSKQHSLRSCYSSFVRLLLSGCLSAAAAASTCSHGVAIIDDSSSRCPRPINRRPRAACRPRPAGQNRRHAGTIVNLYNAEQFLLGRIAVLRT